MTKNRFQKPGSSFGTLLSRSLQLSGGQLPDAPSAADNQPQSLPISALVPNPRQPRRYFDQDSLAQLSESIKERGVLQPLMVRPLSSDEYEIVYGERRWRAAQSAGLSEVPVIVRDLSAAEAEIISAVENLQREDLNRYDEVSYKVRLVAQLFTTTPEDAVNLLKQLRAQPEAHPEQVALLEQLFGQLGREQWRSFVTNGLPALRLPPALIQAVQSGQLDYSKALVIARAPAAHHAALLKKVLTKNLTHAQLSEAVVRLKPVPARTSPALLNVKKKLTPRRYGQLSDERRQRVEALLSELDALLSD